LLSFDITPAWVMNNWQRVSTRLAEFDLEGLRVPLVTGTEVDDLVGTMTYYFDRRQTLQRIAFDGFTGEPTPLVKVMTEELALQAEPWLGAGFYVNRNSTKQLSSVLRISHASVIRASESRRRYTVEFELNRAGSELGLSEQFRSLIESDRNSKAFELTADDTAAEKAVEELENEATPSKLDTEDPAAKQETPRQPSRESQTGNEPISQPQPLNGSAPDDNQRGGLFGRTGTSQPAQGLYPSQLPSNWQRFVPPAP
jgi:hypothetical protein